MTILRLMIRHFCPYSFLPLFYLFEPNKTAAKQTTWRAYNFTHLLAFVMAAQATFKSIRSLVPLLDRVLVQRFKPETKTATGIFLPTSATSSPLPEATVIAVGPGAPDKEGRIVPTSVKAGDRVLLPGWGGNAIKVGEDEYHLFKDSEILAKIEE
ncbi:chaperonin 10-like protein [Lactifluus volemus]|nr:chaperonin 10-like protein [Lactifluus volemus]